MFRDFKSAFWRAPLHFFASIPVAAATLVVPPAGKAYVNWRICAEAKDVESGRDTPEKAAIDLYSQTIAVRSVLWLWGQTE